MGVVELHQPIEAQQPLETRVLTLPEPNFHGKTSSYYDDASLTQAPAVVQLLGELHRLGIDRSKNPVIATYGSRRVTPDFLHPDKREHDCTYSSKSDKYGRAY